MTDHSREIQLLESILFNLPPGLDNHSREYIRWLESEAEVAGIYAIRKECDLSGITLEAECHALMACHYTADFYLTDSFESLRKAILYALTAKGILEKRKPRTPVDYNLAKLFDMADDFQHLLEAAKHSNNSKFKEAMHLMCKAHNMATESLFNDKE